MTKRIFVFGMLIGLGAIFIDLLLSYTPDSALNQTARYYAERTATDLGAANIVAAVIVTYRGLDTLGEVTVLFLTAAILVMVLYRDHGIGINKIPNRFLPPTGEMLGTGSRLLVPLILLMGVYLFANGHLTPGGGFQGGAIIASAVLLLLLTNPNQTFNLQLFSLTESISGIGFVVIGVLGMFFAGGFLDNRIFPIGQLGELFSAGAIPVIYTLIGLKVGAEFSSILVHLSEEKEES
ncbi:MAG: sodium:proton antiporter [Magnetococcales bacterium]|nr:sodium:proton antiporter [Magnetococcales bacterium]